jgi:hypothetical protein
MRLDPAHLDIDAIVHAPLRRRSRARAAFNLIVLPLIAAAGLFWLVGARP